MMMMPGDNDEPKNEKKKKESISFGLQSNFKCVSFSLFFHKMSLEISIFVLNSIEISHGFTNLLQKTSSYIYNFFPSHFFLLLLLSFNFASSNNNCTLCIRSLY